MEPFPHPDCTLILVSNFVIRMTYRLFRFQDLGHAATAGRAIVYFVKPDESYKKYYDEAYEAIKDLPIPL